MGDCAPASIELFGVAGKENEILGCMPSYFKVDWCGPAPELGDIIDGVRLCDDSASIGVEGELLPPLEELGVSYVFCQDAKYENSGITTMFTPELGSITMSADQDEAAMVHAVDIDGLVDTGLDRDGLVDALSRLTGRAWRTHFERLREAAKVRAAA